MKLQNIHIYIIAFALLILSYRSAYAQTQRLSKATSRALNNYIHYSNEVVYGVNIMYADFIDLNMQFDAFVEQQVDTIKYIKENVLTNYDYFPVYPKELFNEIYNDNIYIPYKQRGEPLQLVSKIVGVLDEIEAARATLHKYIRSGEYLQDSFLRKGYKILRRVEVLYYDMFTLQEKLHWSLRTIISQYVHPQIDNDFLLLIRELQPLISQCKIIIKAIRSEDKSNSLSYNRAKLSELIKGLEQRKEALLENIPNNPSSLKSPKRRLETILKKSKIILSTAQQYMSNPQYKGLLHEPNYYYYNAALLPEYNRYGDGIVTLFNKMIDNSSIYWLRDHEMPFLFEVIFPDIPEYADEKVDSIPDPEEFIKKLMLERAVQDSLEQLRQDSLAQVKKDSIVADSIARMKANPDVGDPSLNGFATNNLIFVLDISSSMNEADKLPLLKDAMKYLLELMREEDNVTLITYSNKANLVLSPTSATQKGVILSSIDSLQTEGSSNANKGLSLAYEIAKKSYISGGNNRIILATDGGFKVQRHIKQRIRQNARHRNQQTFLSVFYFSSKEYKHNRELLEEIATLGQGKYSYIQRENAEKTLLIEAQAVRKK